MAKGSLVLDHLAWGFGPHRKAARTLRIGNASEFKRIKDAIELCKNVTEINTLVASEKQNINKLAKYAKDLFIKLKDCKEAMIEILDPAQKESEANLIQGG